MQMFHITGLDQLLQSPGFMIGLPGLILAVLGAVLLFRYLRGRIIALRVMHQHGHIGLH